MYILHCTLYIVHCTLYTVHCTLYIVHCTLYIVHCTLYTAQLLCFTIHNHNMSLNSHLPIRKFYGSDCMFSVDVFLRAEIKVTEDDLPSRIPR